jgi:hypothetical protein
VLAAYVPNFNYLVWKDAGPVSYVRTGRWSQLHPQEHLFHYTPRSLTRILQACGFDVLRIDVGRPFASSRVARQVLKQAAYWAACAMKLSTGIHLGGIEVLARINPGASVEYKRSSRRISA